MPTKREIQKAEEHIYRQQLKASWGKSLEECESDKKKFWVKDQKD